MPITTIWKKIRAFKMGCIDQNRIIPENKNTYLEILDKITPEFPLQNIDWPTEIESVSDFTINELQLALSRKASTPGIDKISYEMFQHLTTESKTWILKAYNSVLTNPDQFSTDKIDVIIPIYKGKGDYNSSDSYRPIMLTSVVSRILHKMLVSRIEWYLENQELLDPRIFGFRKGKGTIEALTLLTTEILNAFSNKEHVMAMMVDIKGAYDHVLITTLVEEIIKLGIPVTYAKVIFNELTFRTTYLRSPYGLLGPRVANRGLPQGSPLSPLLFNIYITQLPQRIPKTNLTIYADDITFFTKGTNLNNSIVKLDDTFKNFMAWMEERGFILNVSKSIVITFNRHNNIQPSVVALQGQNFRTVNSTKMLGLTLDYRLKFHEHINKTIKACSQGLNIMRALSHTQWGADPKTLINIFHGIIRSRIEYGLFLINPKNKTVIDKIEKVQNAALRSIGGYMKTTPIAVMQREINIPPLKYRKLELAHKFIIKNLQINENPIINAVEDLSHETTTKPYWRNKPQLPIVEAFQRTKELEIYKGYKIPCFNTPFKTLFSKPSILIDSKLNKEDINTNYVLKELINSKWPEHTLIFTDASKTLNPSRVGCGIFIPQRKLKVAYTLPSSLNICTAECLAIKIALQLCIELNLSKCLILSDSKAALQKLLKCGIDSRMDVISLETKNLWMTITEHRKFQVEGVWIPGHQNIIGNEVADKLAKSVNAPLHVDIKTPFMDLLPDLKNEIQKTWETEWEHRRVHGLSFARYFPDLVKKPWFLKYNYVNRNFFTTISRMRTLHCRTPTHLYRMNISDTNLCSCGEIGSLNHVILECPSRKPQVEKLQNKLIQLKINPPWEIHKLMSTGNIQVYNAIYQLVRECEIKI